MTDYLTQLPAELFLTICELAYDPLQRKRPYLGLVSKAFLPIARRLAFRHVRVDQAMEFKKLLRVFIASPVVAATVESLDISLWRVTEDEDQPDTKTFLDALNTLVSLKKFDLCCASSVCQEILSPAKQSLLPSLRELTISSALNGWSNPFSPAHYDKLYRYRRLRTLSLNVPRPLTANNRLAAASASPPLRPEAFRIKRLDLSGALIGNAGVTNLINSLGDGASLTLLQCAWSDGSLRTLLANVASPMNFRQLSLTHLRADPEDLSSPLSSFAALQSVVIGRGVAVTSLLPTLAALPALTRLRFAAGSCATASDLLAVVDGAFRLKHLRHVIVQILSDPEPGSTYETFVLDVAKVIEVAETCSVTVTGPVVPQARRQLKARRAREEQARAGGRGAGGLALA